MYYKEDGVIDVIKVKLELDDLIAKCYRGFETTEDKLNYYHSVKDYLEKLDDEINRINVGAKAWMMFKGEETSEKGLDLLCEFGKKESLLEEFEQLPQLINVKNELEKELDNLIASCKYFNKSLCFANIRELLSRNPDVKIGQIEKEAGVRVGYMSRLEKEGNTSNPSIEFIATAANLLNVSLDTLTTIDLAGLTPTEQYLIKFFEKLHTNTLEDRLDWQVDTATDLNNIICGRLAQKTHPLLTYVYPSDVDEKDYSFENAITVFKCKSFGVETCIAGDCFNLRLKNGSYLFLMNYEKNHHKVGDHSAFAIEAWMCVKGTTPKVLMTTNDDSNMSIVIEKLYNLIKERMNHPRLSDDFMYIIDSFMNGDIFDDDDDDDRLPF